MESSKLSETQATEQRIAELLAFRHCKEQEAALRARMDELVTLSAQVRPARFRL